MYPHRIRLRGPWEYEPLARAGGGELPPAGKMTMPCRWAEGGLGGFVGRVRFRRRFGYPGRIDTHERVWLTLAGAGARLEGWLNGTALGAHPGARPLEWDVTGLLQARNELVVEVEGPETGGLWGEVALEVRCLAFLRGVAVRRVGGRLEATGEVVGEVGGVDGPLELYAVVGRRPIGRLEVTPTLGGVPFTLAADWPDLPPDEPPVVRVELVRGAVAWWTIEGLAGS